MTNDGWRSARTALARSVRRVRTCTHAVQSAMRVTLTRLAYPEIEIGRGVRLGAGASLRAFDGGSMRIGAGADIGRNAVLVADGGTLQIGPRGFVGQGTTIVATQAITIGADSLISEFITIRDQDHSIDGCPRNRAGFTTAPIRIGDNVWIAAKASVLRGVTIGDHSVIGAHAVVTRDIAASSIATGVPARVRPIPQAIPSNRRAG